MTAKPRTSKARAAKIPDSPEAWLAQLPAERARELAVVRAAIRNRLPAGYEEVTLKGMIVFRVPKARYADTYNGQALWLAALAAPKSYLTLHLLPVYGSPILLASLKAGFEAVGKRLKMGKGCINFQRADDLALDTIGEIIAAMPVAKWVAFAESVRRR